MSVESQTRLLTDRQLFDELLRRCLKRLECSPYATADERLRNHLYEAGKELVKRELDADLKETE